MVQGALVFDGLKASEEIIAAMPLCVGIDAGALLNIKNASGQTPFYLAVIFI
jgi:hypothetical protein